MSVTLDEQDKLTLRTAAWGAVSLMAAAGAAGSPHKAATEGSIALTSATGLVGHVLTKAPKGLNGKSTAALADQVLPALTAAMSLLKEQAPAEADNFRRTVIVAIEAATRPQKGEVSPTMAEMARKITRPLTSLRPRRTAVWPCRPLPCRIAQLQRSRICSSGRSGTAAAGGTATLLSGVAEAASRAAVILRAISAMVGLDSPFWVRVAASTATRTVRRKLSASAGACSLSRSWPRSGPAAPGRRVRRRTCRSCPWAPW